MSMRSLMQAALGCFAASALAVATTAPPAPPVMLLSEVDLKTRTISLSDLLPATALNALRVEGAKVPLGPSPMPGAVRVMTREEIKSALLNDPELQAEVSIPVEIMLRRLCRPVTPEDVSSAIGVALGHETAGGLSDISLSAPVYFTGDDPGLEVTEIRFDAVQRVTRFRLWTSNEPENLPFYVALPGNLKGATTPVRHSAQAAVGAQKASIGPGVAPGAVLLVSAGVAARLLIEGANYRITSTVVPLQSGSLGQTIRVRDPVTRKILNVKVAAPGVVTGSL
jgi:Chaperone for flagella basal body P-ring formation